MKIKFSKKYQQLFKLLNDDNFKEVDTVIITGGRSSAKSFVVAVFSLMGLVERFWSILYTRFTNASIVDSVKPEVDGKIELLNYQDKVISTNTHIEYKENRIAFKGIKTGSKQQTANLKSLSGFNIFIVDEAEELPDYETFEKVYLSIRSSEKRNITILLLNPASIHHWIYRKFFADRKIEAGSNCVYKNVMYIHTSYLDVPKEYLAKNIVSYYKELEEINPKRYKEIVLGGWTDTSERAIYRGWKYIDENIPFEDIPYPSYYGLDFGSRNPSALVEVKFDGERSFFVRELFYTPRNELKVSLGEAINPLIKDKRIPLICDYAEPDAINDLRTQGYNALPCTPKNVKGRIDFIQNQIVYLTKDSNNLWNEYESYEWEIVNNVNIERPLKQDDHLLDALAYCIEYIKFINKLK